MDEIIAKADVLIEALPYIREFKGSVSVIKYGGSELADDEIRRGILEDIVFMSSVGMKPVLVHGGGPQINERMRKEGLSPEFVKGHRVTDKKTIKIVSEVLNLLTREVVREIKDLGGEASAISGDDGLIEAELLNKSGELGFVGKVASVNTEPLKDIIAQDSIPVVNSLGRGEKGETYNINADNVAGKLASALKAEKLVLLTNVKGIMRDESQEESLISTLTRKEAKDLIAAGVVSRGMIPKAEAALLALGGGVKKAHIIDAKISHSLLLEIFTDKGIGTEIIK